MSNANLKVGDKVMLSEDFQWHKCHTNPLNTLGEVISKGDSSWVRVRWDNATINAYRTSDSDLILQGQRTNSTLENTIDTAKHFYEMYQTTIEEAESLQQRAAYYKANYEDSVKQLQVLLGDGFEVKSVELSPTVSFDRYSYWDVSDWSTYEIQEAARILSCTFTKPIHDCCMFGGYHYLHIDDDDKIVISSDIGVEKTESSLGRHFTERKKADILGYS